ncbi:restriction endonuclease subunit S [Aeromonas salmonicida]|nr:restriction endonuclease subunit S [Aeromonas salmonicida]EKP0243240.1 restriction endonuclease subunit S [Aeromonas salmonicida]EKP0255957.1 restriction endonuclease subunit S [Aeromonas salmonicida]EKP0258647.1 restriction endonuclease subunit S [Aeromonas salmonicida]EKP0282042.1 restriction endonuclease subunit S [Aeromonas salmonicida]
MVPKGWIASQIGDIAKFSSGGTPSKQSAHFWGGTEPWISGKDLKTHYLVTSIDTLTEDGFKVAKKTPKGSSLILVRGMTLLKDFPVGYATREVAFNQDLKALIPNKDIDGLFLSFMLAAEKNKILQLVSTAGHGTGRLDTESIKAYPVNLPPLSEQNKIAEILSTWDKTITTTEQLLANSQQQKKSLMQQLLTGKKRLLDINGMRFSEEWKPYNLSDIAIIIMGSSPKSEAYNEDGVGLPLLQGNADVKNRKSAPRIFTSVITKECAIGDILLSVRAPVGTVAISEHKACIGRGIAAIKAKRKFDQDFIYQWLLWFEKRWCSLSQGSTFESINSDDIKQLIIRAPDFGEQVKIAAVLSTADQEITALQQKLAALKQEKNALMQQLLTGKRRVKVEEAA